MIQWCGKVKFECKNFTFPSLKGQLGVKFPLVRHYRLSWLEYDAARWGLVSVHMKLWILLSSLSFTKDGFMFYIIQNILIALLHTHFLFAYFTYSPHIIHPDLLSQAFEHAKHKHIKHVMDVLVWLVKIGGLWGDIWTDRLEVCEPALSW